MDTPEWDWKWTGSMDTSYWHYNPQNLHDWTRVLVETARDHKNVLDSEFQKHLLWRHRKSYFAALEAWKKGGEMKLAPYPMAIPIVEWRSGIKIAIEDQTIREHLTTHYPKAFTILHTMWNLCAEAEKVVAQPSSANDHLAIMESQLRQLAAIRARAKKMEEETRRNPLLTDEEKTDHITLIQELCRQRLYALLKEDEHASKDEVISPDNSQPPAAD